MRTLLSFILALAALQSQAQRHDNPTHYLKSAERKLRIFLKPADFREGEQVADVGAGNGWFDAAIGIYEDSLTFTLEEIDSSFIKRNRLGEALLAYASIKGSPITSTYTQTIGTEKSTLLPTGKFDKVIMIDTYHHLANRDEMIDDIYRILRVGGRLIIYEPVGKKKGEVFKACNSLLLTSEEVITAFTTRKFHLEGSYDGVKSAGKKANIFVFEKRE